MQVLYHGGSADVLDRVKRDGIQPRARHKGKDHWRHTVTSNKDAVYLTDAYPWHFAAVAADDQKGTGIIYEINRGLLLPWWLCPDEDFLEQGSRKQGPPEYPNFAPPDWPMKKRTMFYRKSAKYNPQLADGSLEHMGTAGYYGTIPWTAVTRYVLIEWQKLHIEMRIRAIDSQVSIINYKILQDRHRAFIRWFFNDPVTPAELCGHWWDQELTDDLKAIYTKTENAMAPIMADRTGLTVVTNEQHYATLKKLA